MTVCESLPSLTSTDHAQSTLSPLGLFGPWMDYAVDVAQRSVLFFDVLRQRGNQAFASFSNASRRTSNSDSAIEKVKAIRRARSPRIAPSIVEMFSGFRRAASRPNRRPISVA